VVDEGEACLMLGTAGNLMMPTREPCFDSRLVNSHHVGCDRWLALGGTLCGAALEWFRSACAPGVEWDVLEGEARAVEPGESSPVWLPYFQGERTPVWDESARGVISGLDLTHGRAHLYRALLDGVALGFRHCMLVAGEAGVRFGGVVAANGAGRSSLLRQTLADALGVPLVWFGRAGAGATVTGAALLAALGTGVVDGPGAVKPFAWAACGEPVRHDPDARAHARLEKLFARRLELYSAVRGR
jgi:xylulokinase